MNLNNNLIKILEKMNYDDEEREIIQYGLEQFFSILLDVVTFIICGILWKELFFTLLIFLGVFFLRPYAGGYHADTKFNCYLITTIMMNIAIWMKKKLIFFTLLIFLGVFFLRPYAGGYHADTKFNCYLITTIMMNIAIWMKKKLILSNITLVGIWISTTIFIVIYAPVENPIHCLVKQEQKKYREKTKKILLYNAIMMLAGVCFQWQFIVIYAPVENPIHCLVKQEQKKYREKTKKILLYNAIMMLAGVCFQWQFLLKVIVWVQVITAIAMAAGLWKYNRFSEKRL